MLVFASLALFSCSKDDDDGKTAKPNNPNNPDNPNGNTCIVTRFIEEISPVSDRTVNYEYDSHGRIIKISDREDGIQKGYQTVEHNAAGKVSQVNHFSNNKQYAYAVYDYNNDGLLIKSRYYSDMKEPTFTLLFFKTYEYNTNKQLIKLNELNTSPPYNVSGYSEITYPSATTAISRYYVINNGIPELETTAEYTFDDKKSPILLLGVLYDYYAISTHNIVSVKYTEASGESTTFTYTYQYNEAGFPTHKTNSYSNKTTRIEYNCSK